jgi:hypothetical protein
VTDRNTAGERLREAFQSLGRSSGREPSHDDLERIWRAVAGELPAPERRDLVDRMASDPALAEAWRVAHDLSRSAARARRATPARRDMPWWTQPWGAAAAVAVALVAGFLLQRC